MNPEIKTVTEKKLIGKRIRTTLADDKTVILWQSFMPRHREIQNKVGSVFFSLRIYDEILSRDNMNNPFEKWAAVEVPDFDFVPGNMETYTLSGGLYAVFLYKGLNTDHSIYQYIYGTWLTGSAYALDDRPHFEIMGEKYRNNDPDSEEEIWIPVKLKN
ncbi:MAG: transcription activator effector binding protein [Bacteroidetes bacterium]|nr:MAG: transcription activator effector binding protein [Bacteroidota bacterium]